MHDLTSFERDLMYIIANTNGLNGTEVNDRIESYYEEEIYDGRLYPALNKLYKKGLIEKNKRDQRTNEYRLTTRGKNEVVFRRRWEDDVSTGLFD